jgi:gamma-glutamylcyclotransferase (GGCT)/AIG2-like uncharacterized protein YtfP
MTQYIFVYGTLRLENIRRELLGHETLSTPGRLKGFSMDAILLDNIEYPIIWKNTASTEVIEGEYFEVNENDLKKLDVYESSAYKRILAELENHLFAWVYIQDSLPEK